MSQWVIWGLSLIVPMQTPQHHAWQGRRQPFLNIQQARREVQCLLVMVLLENFA